MNPHLNDVSLNSHPTRSPKRDPNCSFGSSFEHNQGIKMAYQEPRTLDENSSPRITSKKNEHEKSSRPSGFRWKGTCKKTTRLNQLAFVPWSLLSPFCIAGSWTALICATCAQLLPSRYSTQDSRAPWPPGRPRSIAASLGRSADV